MEHPVVEVSDKGRLVEPPRLRSRFRPLRSPAGVALAIVAYRILLDVAYRPVVGGPFGYYGFRDAPTASGIFLSWVFLLAVLPLLVRLLRTETLSANVTTVLALVSLVPTTTLIAYDPRYSVGFILLIFLYWLFFLLTCLFFPTVRPFRRPVRSDVLHFGVAALLSATILFISWRYTGFRLHFGLLDIYDMRVEARGFQVPTILGYFAAMADNALPVLLAIYLRRGWVLVAAALGVVILFNYGIAATKQVLFLLPFAVASVAIGKEARLNRLIVIGLAAVVVVALAERFAIGTNMIGMLSLFRLMFLPAQMHWVYYDFLQTRELLYLTQSALRFFFASPYQENIQFLIGDYLLGEIAARGNNGLFTDGYMNFGTAGVFIFPPLVVFVLKVLDGAAEGLSSGVRFMLTVMLSFVFLGLPLTTAILSASVGLLILLLPTLPRVPGSAKSNLTAHAYESSHR
jgi:hypothetical protein